MDVTCPQLAQDTRKRHMSKKSVIPNDCIDQVN